MKSPPNIMNTAETGLRLAGLGELLWDVLPGSETLGGAPANFACHAQALGAHAALVSTVGSDGRGSRAKDILKRSGVDTSCISTIDHAPTGYVQAELDEQGVATYHFPDDVAWDHLLLNHSALALTPVLHGVCFGTLAQRSAISRAAMHRFLSLLPPAALKVYDINLRQHFYSQEIIEHSLEICQVLKLNDDELALLSKMFELGGDQTDKLDALVQRWNLELAILTRGSDGSLLISGDQRSDHPGVEAEIIDTIGAGDAFTAAAVLGLLLDKTLDEINERANQLAAFVCSRSGAIVSIPEPLKYT